MSWISWLEARAGFLGIPRLMQMIAVLNGLGLSVASFSTQLRLCAPLDPRKNPPWRSLASCFLQKPPSGNAFARRQSSAATAFPVCLPLVPRLDGRRPRTRMGRLPGDPLLFLGYGRRDDCSLSFRGRRAFCFSVESFRSFLRSPPFTRTFRSTSFSCCR